MKYFVGNFWARNWFRAGGSWSGGKFWTPNDTDIKGAGVIVRDNGVWDVYYGDHVERIDKRKRNKSIDGPEVTRSEFLAAMKRIRRRQRRAALTYAAKNWRSALPPKLTAKQRAAIFPPRFAAFSAERPNLKEVLAFARVSAEEYVEKMPEGWTEKVWRRHLPAVVRLVEEKAATAAASAAARAAQSEKDRRDHAHAKAIEDKLRAGVSLTELGLLDRPLHVSRTLWESAFARHVEMVGAA